MATTKTNAALLEEVDNTATVSETRMAVDMRKDGNECESSNQKGARSSSSSSKETSSSSEETSSSSDDDDDEAAPPPPAMIRPVFVPKSKRGLVQLKDETELEEETKLIKLKQQQELRQKESRALVQQLVTQTKRHTNETNEGLEGVTGARNEIPDDDDDNDSDSARDAWEVRELERLLRDWDIERQRHEEARELARRRTMTDEERMREADDAQRTDRGADPGHTHTPQQPYHKQRFFHRGAFYMDESEWTGEDVRHKAVEYARAATGETVVDRRALPRVMQVKKFGFANQSKYKGLKAEDTTDRQMEMLPLPRKKKG